MRVLLALAGAAIVLWPEGGRACRCRARCPTGWAWSVASRFALNNVMLRREARRPEESRALAMFLGGVLVAGSLATVLGLQGQAPGRRRRRWAGWRWRVALSVFFLISNMALQYGAARLPANVASVVMLTEVLFASVSALLAGRRQR